MRTILIQDVPRETLRAEKNLRKSLTFPDFWRGGASSKSTTISSWAPFSSARIW